ncbi:Metacaspase pca1 [Mycena kentingensis (nom. inval.)]|nr:Metacaspase pca1 [Mycena kentingensis (nom. inval.)]
MPLRACHHHRARRTPPSLIPPSNPTMHSAAPAVLAKSARLGSKRALLIGIGKSVGAAYPELKAAHEDVRKMRELLLDCYGYRPEQIVVLVDDGVSGRRQPTRVNILTAIAKLVKGVVAGDQLCFYYSGHSTQIDSPETPNRLPTEEDRLDECLVPLGGEKDMIIDNELHDALVLPLPTGARLTAVVDTCHSGSLLDLKHYKCNAKGYQNDEPPKPRRGFTSIRRASRFTSWASSLFPPPPPAPAPVGRRAPTRRATIFPDDSGSGGVPGLLARTATDISHAAAKLATPCIPRLAVQTEDLPHPSSSSSPPVAGLFSKDGTFCESPRSVYCTGNCRTDSDLYEDPSTARVRADVVSLASCRDSQQAWETPDGETMTGCLVAYLRRARFRRGKGREPTLGEVLRAVSFATARLGTERRARAGTYLARTRAWLGALRQHIGRTERKRGGRAGTARGVWVEKRREMLGYEAVQNPEMRSARPLDMGRVWTM